MPRSRVFLSISCFELPHKVEMSPLLLSAFDNQSRRVRMIGTARLLVCVVVRVCCRSKAEKSTTTYVFRAVDVPVIRARRRTAFAKKTIATATIK